MAAPRTLSFSNFKVYVSDTDSPGVFTAPCGFTQKSLEITAETSDTNVPDCDTPEDPAWTERAVTALSAAIAGQGVMAMASLTTWRTWMLAANARTVRVEFADTLANGGGYYEGDAICQSLGHAVALGADGNKAQLSVNLVSTGEWTWTPALS
jgi:hypothetical protein